MVGALSVSSPSISRYRHIGTCSCYRRALTMAATATSSVTAIGILGAFLPPHLPSSPSKRSSLSMSRTSSNLRPSFQLPLPRSEVLRRNVLSSLLAAAMFPQLGFNGVAIAKTQNEFKEYIHVFDGYSLLYPKNWIQVRGVGADIFFRDPFVLDENLSIELSSPSSSSYKSVEDLGSPQEAAEKVLKQYLTEFMSTRLGVRRESSILSTSSRVADDGKLYYLVEVNIKSYANNNEMAIMPLDRISQLEWDRRYLSVLGVGNNRLYELRLQTPESVFLEEEDDLRDVMNSFRVINSVD